MLTLDPAGVPASLREGAAFCCWRYVERGGTPTKVPSRPDGTTWRSNDPASWVTFDEALAAKGYAGVGRALDGDLCGVDLDWKHAPDVPESGPSWLRGVLDVLGSWTELSPSGRGVHVWLRGEWRGRARQQALPGGCAIEVYDRMSPRYFTLTGRPWPGSPAEIRSGPEAQAALDRLAEEMEKLAGAKPRTKGTKGNGHADDELPVAAEGQRRAVLTSEAGRLRALGVSRAEGRAVLLEVARRCSPPVPEEHADEILEWAWRKPAGEPRLCPICDRPEPCGEHRAAPPAEVRPVDPEAPVIWLRDALRDAVDELDRFHVGDLSDFLSTGIPALDQKLGGGLRRRQVTMLGAPTGGGKTTLLMCVASAAAEQGTVLFVTPEMAAAELAVREIVRRSRVMKWARRPWNPRPDSEREHAAAAHTLAASRLAEAGLPIAFVDQPAISMDDVEVTARRLQRERGPLSLVVIDYAQEIADSDPRTPRYLTVGAVASRSIQLAAELGAAVVIASQVNVVREGNEETFALRESQVLKHKAHFVLEFAVEWEKRGDGSRKVKAARIRCPKARNGPGFELALDYRPELYSITAIEDEPR